MIGDWLPPPALPDEQGRVWRAVRSAAWTEFGARHERESEQLNRLLCDDASGEEYGVDRLCERVKACGHSSPHEIRDAVVTSVGDFIGAVAPPDDLTLVVASFGSSEQTLFTFDDTNRPPS